MNTEFVITLGEGGRVVDSDAFMTNITQVPMIGVDIENCAI